MAWYRADGHDASAAALLRHLERTLAAALEGLQLGWKGVEEAVDALAGGEAPTPCSSWMTFTCWLRRFSGWTFEARQSRSGMILQPASAAEGELLDIRLPRSTGSQAQTLPGRGVLAARGRWVVAQVLLPAPPA